MRNLVLLAFLVLLSCQSQTVQDPPTNNQLASTWMVAQIVEEHFVIDKDSMVFKGRNIENFDTSGNSVDVYWIGEQGDTSLRFYRIYDQNRQLIGAEYYYEGETLPSKDSVFIQPDGTQVEVSLNTKNQITWQSTTTFDKRGNPVVRSYQNGKGEARGVDSLFYGESDREIKSFYTNVRGEKGGLRTYEYLQFDKQGSWTARKFFVDDTLQQKQFRVIRYHP